jgi:ribosomal protein S18 acetylase RimI-like enzyme
MQRITPELLPLYKQVRLEALRDAPLAFSSTWAHESQLSDAEWRERIDRWNGDGGAGFLAIDNKEPCGLAGLLVHPDNPTRATVVSVWIAPAQRRSGLAARLLEELIGWAGARHLETLDLMVTEGNLPAFRLYERLGFRRTGRSERYPNDPSLLEWEMALALRRSQP